MEGKLLDETLAKVLARWKAENLGPFPPLDDVDLRTKLGTLGVEASGEVLHVFSTLNGFDDDEMDSECFAFWSIDKIIAGNSNDEICRDQSYIHFADFLIFSHTYAFNLPTSESVSVYCHYELNYKVKIADSFEEYFEYYLTNDRRLFPE